MSVWEDKTKELVLRLTELNENEVAFRSISYKGKLHYPNKNSIISLELIAGYSQDHDIYAFWNPYLHHYGAGATVNVSLGMHPHLYKLNFETLYPIYKSLNYKKFDEKVILVNPKFLPRFCEAYELFLRPNTEDEGFRKNVAYAAKNMPIKKWLETELCIAQTQHERKKISASLYERDRLFRKRILNLYGGKCAICRCAQEYVLEAAHIYAVQHGGSDDDRNGICLCANHHKMYDNKVIKFDFANNTIVVDDKSLLEEHWYKEFISIYGGRLVDTTGSAK